jgi:GT2 family glycosyltransferase
VTQAVDTEDRPQVAVVTPTAEVDLSVVIPSYNTRDLIEQALRTVQEASRGISVEIIVVDNASRDGSADMVAERFPEVELIRNERNVGFGGANNQAFEQVRGRHVLLLNSDTIVRPDTLSTLVAFMDEHPEAGAAGCRILNPDGTLQLESRRGFPTPGAAFYKLTGLARLFPNSRRFARYHMTYLDPDELSEVDALSGSCMIVRREVLDQVGGFDPSYFMYGEDLDWCFRMREAGWKIFYTPTTEIIHFRGESGRAESLRIQYRKNEAMAIFVSKHMRQRYRFFPVALLHLGIVLYGLYKILGPLARKAALPLLDGLLVLAGLHLAVALRYHPDLSPLIRGLERLSLGVGFDVHPTRWLEPPPYSETQWLLVYAAPVAIWLVCFAALGLYDRRRYSPGWAALAVALGFGGVVTTAFFFKDYNFSRLAAIAAWGANTVLIAGWRLGARWLTQSTSGRRLGRRRLLVVGTDEAARRFVAGLRDLGGLDAQVIGFVGSAEERGRTIEGAPVVGLVEDVASLAQEHDVDEIVFTPASVTDALRHVRASRLRRRRQVLLTGDLPLGAQPAPQTLDDLPLVEIAAG